PRPPTSAWAGRSWYRDRLVEGLEHLLVGEPVDEEGVRGPGDRLAPAQDVAEARELVLLERHALAVGEPPVGALELEHVGQQAAVGALLLEVPGAARLGVDLLELRHA